MFNLLSLPFVHEESTQAVASFSLDFVCIGPQRTGTSWLHQVLSYHPDLCLPQDVKETMFFDRDYKRGINWYARYFSHRQPKQRCGEIGPTYFDVDCVPEYIQLLNPDCKIIVNLRHPISRALSLYRHHLSKGRVKGSFSEATLQIPRIVEAGRYEKHISKWLSIFPQQQVAFVLIEDIECQPEAVLRDLCVFLEVKEIEMPYIGYQKIGAATVPKFPWLAQIAAQGATWLRTKRLHRIAELGKAAGLKRIYSGGEKQLAELTPYEYRELWAQYEEDICFVERLLNRDLTVWRKP